MPLRTPIFERTNGDSDVDQKQLLYSGSDTWIPDSTFEKVTPEIVKSWLATSPGNRDIKSYNVNGIARDMVSGNFAHNGDQIKFKDGKLVDGHHRLLGFLKSELSDFTFQVIWNVQNPSLIDIGAKRSYADTLRINHELYSQTVASGMSYLTTWKLLKTFKTTGSSRPNRSEIQRVFEDNPKFHKLCQTYGKTGRRKGLKVSSALCAALHYLFGQINHKRADLFMNQITEGTDLQNGDPALTFRNWIMKAEPALVKSSIHQSNVANYLIYCWNKFIIGDKLFVLNKVQSCPPICGMDGKAFSDFKV